ncbi:MAG: HAD family phosphatase [Candidatus Acidiferrales bacterium]
MSSDSAPSSPPNAPGATARPAIRAVVFDFGEVLSLGPDPTILARLAAVFGLPPAAFIEAYHPTRIPYDRGDVSAEVYWRGFAKSHGVSLDARQIEALQQCDQEMWSRISLPMTDWLSRLHHSGYRTAILSNMQAGMVEHVRQNFDWLSDFDVQVFSCEVRLAKPEPAIFAHLLGCLAIAPGEVLFIDDRAANVEAARAAGIVAIQMTSVAQLRRDLAALGFPILPVPSSADSASFPA